MRGDALNHSVRLQLLHRRSGVRLLAKDRVRVYPCCLQPFQRDQTERVEKIIFEKLSKLVIRASWSLKHMLNQCLYCILLRLAL